MQTFLISNAKFMEMCDVLKEKTYYNPGGAMLTIEDEVRNGLGNISSVVNTTIVMPGNHLLDFMREQYEPGQSLHQILIIVGTLRQAYITTCLQYMEDTWPESGQSTVDILDCLIQTRSSYSIYNEPSARRFDSADLT